MVTSELMRRQVREGNPRRVDAGAVRRRANIAGVRSLRTGLQLSSEMRFDCWVEVGRRVRAHEDASLWWLGDWLNHGKERYGRCYRRGIDLVGLEYQTLRNYAMVARRFELSRRRDTLSFHHHAELCAYSEQGQDRWLDLAERERWTRNELRRRLRDERTPDAPNTPVALRVSVDADCQVRWAAAAAAIGLDLDAWIVRTLDRAALELKSTAA